MSFWRTANSCIRFDRDNEVKLLEGKKAVVTGSTRGIGRAIAVELARFGARVVLNHRGGRTEADSSVQEVVERIRATAGYDPIVIPADMAEESEAVALARQAAASLDGLDIWVNNVGQHIVTPAMELSASEWERQFRINVTTAFVGCREAAAQMKGRGGGAIVNVASKMGIVGQASNSCYCAAKAAVIMMSSCLAAEWAPFGIRVNALAPGVTLTEPTFKIIRGNPELEAALCYRTPLQRMAEPEEIARAAVFLCSDLASYVTGATLSCDGGWVGGSDFAGIPVEKLESWRQEFPRRG
jgi:NAD(P)-dependent dehydrogenase (short-subunit alcohol dehydrogenase family)